MSGRCQLQKVEALLDPRQPAARPDPWQPVIDGLKAMNAAEKFIDDAIDKAKGATGEKAFRGLQARVALAGMQLIRSDARDGPQRLFVVNGLKAMEIRCLDDLEGLLNYLQGR